MSGLFFASAIDAKLLAVSAEKTLSVDDGWKPFQDHLSHVSSCSTWIGLVFLVFVGFALPRAHLVVRRYFSGVKVFQIKWALPLLAALFFLGGAIGLLAGSLVDRVLTATNLVH